MVFKEMIRAKIEQVADGRTTVDMAVNDIFNWYLADTTDDRDYIAQFEEAEEIRKSVLLHAAFATGMPDLFSDEMREYWNA